MVRQASIDDLPRLLTLLRNFHTDGRFSFQFDPARLDRFMRHAITANDFAVFVVGHPVAGVVVARAADSIIAPMRFAEEQLIWVEPNSRGTAWSALMSALEVWACEQGCNSIKLSSQQSIRPEAMARLYRRCGYAPCETVFSKDL